MLQILQCQALGGVTLSQEAQNFQREFLITEGKTTNLVLVSVSQRPATISKWLRYCDPGPKAKAIETLTYKVAQKIEK